MPLPLIILHALQAGALVALTATFGSDALHRRDRMMVWLAMSCLFVSVRHSTGVFLGVDLISADVADRIQSAMASLGFYCMSATIRTILPSHFPKRFTLYVGLGIAPNLVRTLFLPLDALVAQVCFVITLLAYAGGCVATIAVVTRAKLAGDAMANRLFGGLVLAIIPVLVEIIASLGFGLRLPISGIAIMFMTTTIGVSWLWVINQDHEQKLKEVAHEAAAWRGLLPGITWRNDEDSGLMEQVFARGWRERLADRISARDGTEYLVHRSQLGEGTEIGWLEVQAKHAHSRGGTFLHGWSVAIGMDDGEECEWVRRFLESLGATTERWGPVPPREGPYPSLLLWAREPSILSVWREDDIARRTPRWIQVGGAEIEGPHARLPRPLNEETLQHTLRRLLSFRR